MARRKTKTNRRKHLGVRVEPGTKLRIKRWAVAKRIDTLSNAVRALLDVHPELQDEALQRLEGPCGGRAEAQPGSEVPQR